MTEQPPETIFPDPHTDLHPCSFTLIIIREGMERWTWEKPGLFPKAEENSLPELFMTPFSGFRT